MFTVYAKDEFSEYPNQPFVVYAVRNDSSGYPNFLIYYNNRWIWKSAKYFSPN